MSIDDVKTMICDLPQEDYRTLVGWMIGPERKRRERSSAQADLITELQATGQLAPDAVIPMLPLVPAEPIPEEPTPPGEEDAVIPEDTVTEDAVEQGQGIPEQGSTTPA